MDRKERKKFIHKNRCYKIFSTIVYSCTYKVKVKRIAVTESVGKIY